MENGKFSNGQDFVAKVQQIKINNPDRAVIQMGHEFWRIKARPGNQTVVNYKGTNGK